MSPSRAGACPLPDGRRDGTPFYLCGSCEGAEEPVYFDVVDGVVRRIRFSYYVD